jgi:hypothetical protein
VENTRIAVKLEAQSKVEVEEIKMDLVNDKQELVHYFDNVEMGENVFSLKGVDLGNDNYYLSTVLFGEKDGKLIYMDQNFSDNFSVRHGEINEVSIKFK